MATRFAADYAKRNAKCKQCKQGFEKETVRLAKVVPNFFVARKREAGDENPLPDMKMYYHPKCLFDTFEKARKTTRVIESTDDIEDWDDIKDADRTEVEHMIAELVKSRAERGIVSGADEGAASAKNGKGKKAAVKEEEEEEDQGEPHENTKADLFYKFCRLCETIREAGGAADKTHAIRDFIKKDGYNGDPSPVFGFLVCATVAAQRNYPDTRALFNMFAEAFETTPSELIAERAAHDRDIGKAVQVVAERVRKEKATDKDGDGTRQERSDWHNDKVERWLTEFARSDLSAEEKTKRVKFIVKYLPPFELGYVARLATRNLNLDLDDAHVWAALHSAAAKAAKDGMSVKSIVRRAADGTLGAKGAKAAAKKKDDVPTTSTSNKSKDSPKKAKAAPVKSKSAPAKSKAAPAKSKKEQEEDDDKPQGRRKRVAAAAADEKRKQSAKKAHKEESDEEEDESGEESEEEEVEMTTSEEEDDDDHRANGEKTSDEEDDDGNDDDDDDDEE